MQTEGVFHHRAHLSYAATVTAVGHASLFTGRPPRDHGIVANARWDRRRSKVVAMLDDGEHAVLGVPDRFSSPAALRVESVADALRAERGARARIVGASGKERGAVIPAGQRPDAAIWYEPRARGFTTSSYYAAAEPRWLARWQKKHPVRGFFDRWVPLEVGRIAALAGPDDAKGEGGFRGLGPTFPHELRRVAKPYEAILATPAGTELLLAVVRRAVKEYRLGEDDVPDLLTISISGTDYAGHVWGPESWEMADNLVRVDGMLGELYDWLDDRGPVAMLITADHGGTPLPESPHAPRGARRILDAELLGAVDRGIDAVLGPGDWVQQYIGPYLYLRPDALAQRARAVPAAIRALSALPGVAGAYDVARVAEEPEPRDTLERAVWRSIAPGRGGEIYIVPGEGTVIGDGTPPRSGSDHGTPWEEDAEVPVLMLGAGVGHMQTRSELPQDRVAATISALLGVRPPAGAPSRPLPGLVHRAR